TGRGAEVSQGLGFEQAIDRNLFDHSADCIKVMDLDGRLLSMNQSGICLLQIGDVNEVLGKPWQSFWQEEYHEAIATAIATAKAGGTGRFHGYCPTAQGTPKWWDVSVIAVLNSAGDSQSLIAISRDVTAIHRSENALRESHEQLANILESITDAFFSLDEEWRFTFANPQAGVLLQRAQADLMGKNVWEEFPEAVGSDFYKAYHRAIAEQTTVQFEAYYPPLESWFEVRAYPAQRGLAVYFQNVSARKAAEAEREELLQQEQAARAQVEELLRQLAMEQSRLEQVLQQMPIGISISEAPSGKLLFHNEEAERILRHPLLAAATYEDYGQYGGFHPETGQLYQPEDYPIARSLLQGEVVKAEELYYRRGDGTNTVFSISAAPIFDPGGQMTAVVCTFEDIASLKQAETALRDSEQRYKLLAEMIPQFVWITSAAGQNEYVNRQFCEYTGLSEADLLHMDWLEIIHPDDRQPTQERWMNAVQVDELYEIEYRFRRFDGTYRWFLGQGRPLKNEQGEIVRWFGTCTDIHDQKQIELERAQLLAEAQAAHAEAEAASRMKDEFLAIVSHELRSPLNAMLGWAKLLRAGNLNDDLREKAVQVIERNAEAQTQLIEDLLDISRIIRGKVRLNSMPVHLAQVVEAAIDTIRPSADIKQIQVESRLQQKMAVQGDLDRLQQVVWNLLSNAVKFTPEGGQVTVALAQVGNRAEIRVVDTGKGINPDFLPHVFDRFRQAENVTTRTTAGLGLGLAIIRSLVEMHGGTVRVESQGEGLGTTFIVQLPLIQGLPLQPESETPSLASDTDSLEGLRILVVDDEQDTREFMVTALETFGATVMAAASAEEAIQTLKAFQPDVLFSDIGMPNQDGYALIQRVRALPPEQGGKIPAVALTAFARQEDRMQAIAAGFQMHVTKPIEPTRLVSVTKMLAAGKEGRSTGQALRC
ncbi:MAG: PAS domain S-box protein, partial [Oculatellaceae cyanobacterium Prado106]|nr:PAS domain S-box protein [Oculatellaceae cyanobacterium Prado106]